MSQRHVFGVKGWHHYISCTYNTACMSPKTETITMDLYSIKNTMQMHVYHICSSINYDNGYLLYSQLLLATCIVEARLYS